MSGHHTSPLRPENEDLLQAALSDPFSVPPNLPRVSPSSQPTSPAAAAAAAASSAAQSPPSEEQAAAAAPGGGGGGATSDPSLSSSSSSSISAAEQEAWKADYEIQVTEWRRQSADVRTRAEAERARWEERRARERAEQAERLHLRQRQDIARADTSVTSASEWEAVSSQQSASVLLASSTADSASASVSPFALRSGDVSRPGSAADVHGRGSGTGAGAPTSHSQGSHSQQNPPRSTSSNVPPPSRSAPSAGAQTAATGDPSDSPNWEHLPSSPTSSFPSMSFPEPSRPHSPEHPHPPPRTTTPATAPPATAASATLAVFDHTLPANKRFWALLSSLSINMFLPFVNGVMLGFGEIFAKTVVVKWLGWGPTVATNLGLGGGRSQRRWW